jgi:hypothetical protein
MPKTSKIRKPAPRRKPHPVEIKFSFLLQDDGSIIAAYEGTDERTHVVGTAVLECIANEYGFQLTTIA